MNLIYYFFILNLSIYCIDIGEGDATLIISPSGKKVLIDAGHDSVTNIKLLPYLLDTIGIHKLDYIIITHYHRDHIGGIPLLVNNLTIDSIDTIYDRGWYYNSLSYQNYVNAIGIKRYTINDGQVIQLDSVAIVCVSVNGNGILLPPYVDTSDTDGVSENDFCVALKVIYKNFTFFVGGDLSGTTIGEYHDIETSVAQEVGNVCVYRVNHHGSKYSSNEFFINTLSPKASIISVGYNHYGHPDSVVINRLQNIGSAIYQTEDSLGNVINGNIVITTDGNNFFTINNDTFYISPPIGIKLWEKYEISDKYFIYNILGRKITNEVFKSGIYFIINNNERKKIVIIK